MKKLLLFFLALLSTLALQSNASMKQARTTPSSSMVVYDTISCSYAASIAPSYRDTTRRYTIIGFITEMNTTGMNIGQSFWMADMAGTEKTLYVSAGTLVGAQSLSVGMKVVVDGYLYNYNKEIQVYDGIIRIAGSSSSVVAYDTVNVTIPGTLGQALLQKYNQWTDAKNLAVIGSINETDMGFFSRLTSLCNLDLTQTDIKEIGGLSGLTNLETVLLPSTITVVKPSAFSSCSQLKSISLPNVTKVGYCAFADCSGLTSIDLPKAQEIGYGGNDLGRARTFSGCTSLKTINLPEVTQLGKYDFASCYSLYQVNIPKVQSIDEKCFYNCSSLAEIDLSNVTKFGYWCFSNCKSLSKVTLSPDLKEIPQYCFEYCSSLSSITLPEGLLSIRTNAFDGCPIKSITLPASLQTLDDAFSSLPSDVYAYMIAPIATSAFSDDKVSSSRLHVPAVSVSSYRLHGAWYKFGQVLPMEDPVSSIVISSDYSLLSQDGLSENVDITLSTEGHLTIATSKPLTISNFSQTINPNSVYASNNNYTYSYSTLLNYDNVSANSIAQTYLFYTDRWYFISFPYDVNVSDIEVPEETLWVIRKYSGSDRAAVTGKTWQNMDAGTVLNAGEGYIFQCTNPQMYSVDVTFKAVDNAKKNNLFATTDVTLPLTMYDSEFAHNRGWNLVGNPYPSYYRTQELTHEGVITTWNGSGYTAYSLVDDDYYLRPNEAFFVQCAAAGQQMVFAKKGRTHEYETLISSNAPVRTMIAGSSDRDVYNLTLANQTYSDNARFVINEQASLNYELTCDASKFMSTNLTVPQLYTIQNEQRMAINERPCGNATIQLGMYCGEDGEYTLSFSTSSEKDLHPILIDNVANTRTDLSLSSYSFTATKGTFNNRFSISLRKQATDLIGEENAILTEGDVYTMGGCMVMHITSRDQLEMLTSGCYLLRSGKECEKVVVK